MFTRTTPGRISLLSIALLMLASVAAARVISYAPYTDRTAFPALQSRMNRYFVLVEMTTTGSGGPIPSPPPPYYGSPAGQLVLYDSTGATEPRVLLPKDGSPVGFTAVAVRETNGIPVILVQTNADIGGNASREVIWLLSTDAGTTWKKVDLPKNTSLYNLGNSQGDVGGPFANSRYSQIRIGTAAIPFVVSFQYYGSAPPPMPITPPPPPNMSAAIFSVASDGTVKQLATSTTTSYVLVGGNRDGSRMLVRGPSDTLSTLDVAAGQLTKIATIEATDYAVEGWLTPKGDVFLDERASTATTVSRYSNGARAWSVSQPTNYSTALGVFGVPTYDYSGAWVIQRGSGHPTTLTLNDGQNATLQWSDITGPEVEALHTGASGNTLLIQVHRTRPQIDQRMFKDPALAFWKLGDPAPNDYDELFMNEQTTKGFVHLDVDAAKNGAPWVFDSGTYSSGGVVISPGVPPPSGGGSDVIQEWGVVRASFAQHLVLPGVGRTNGANGSYWKSDLILYNPLSTAQRLLVYYVPNGNPNALDTCAAGPSPPVCSHPVRVVTLDAREIRLIPDSLKTLFNIDDGSGAYYLEPDAAINATSRTYTTASNGTYGFGMNAIDMFAGSASPRFPVTFSGAFAGPNFRTNLIMTDVSGRGTDAKATALGFAGIVSGNANFSAPANGQQQMNSISIPLGLTSTDAGALVIQPLTGQAIASVFTIDNFTNDPTYFPPDLPSPIVRTIPAIGHLDGANNSKFRSDLYMYNPSTQTRQLTLQMKMWDSSDTQTLNFTLLGGEARVIPDVLFKLFNRTGIARLRYQSIADASGIRVTSRTYSVDDNGGTYGFLMPPLNNFQAAASGDTLEILGVVGGKGFRTNIGLVELSAFAAAQPAAAKVEIIDEHGATLDSFTVNVPSAGGMQLTDIFHARNLGDGPEAALIRISPTSGMIGAYATMNDNGTNDPTYLAANLGAHE